MPITNRITPIKGRLILAEGEQTGHHHSIKATANVVLMTDGVETFLQVQDRPVELVHQEHSTLSIVPGDYEVVQQRRVTPGDARRSYRAFD